MATQTHVMATPPATTTGPIATAERIDVLDVLRGFALWGIVVINILAFKSPGGPAILFFEGGSVDRFVVQAILLFVESKFFTLFSFLFGLGFAVQLARAQERGVPFVPRFPRRLLVLLVFGIAHVVLLWDGDILVIYALVGFLLLLFRNRSPRSLLRWAAVLLLVPLLLVIAGLVTLEVLRVTPFTAQIGQAEAEFQATYAQMRLEGIERYGGGTYWAILVQRVTDYLAVLPLLVSRVPAVLAMFLLGLYVGKQNMLRTIPHHLPLLRRVRMWGLGVGIVASLLVVLAQTQLSPISAVVALLFNQTLAGPVLSMGYVATLVLAWQRPRWKRRLAPLAATGRMALTNYLGQSLICAVLFYGYGFGLTGQVGVAASALLATSIYALQTLWSVWWLRRFQFGPLEWVWRSLTYGTLQPFRRVISAQA